MRGAVLTLIGVLSFFLIGKSYAGPPEEHNIGIEDVEEILLLKAELNSNQLALEKINNVLNHLENRKSKYKNEDDFVEYLYYFTHRKLLKTYTQFPSLEETLVSGRYDCLTATTVYSILLSELDIDHAVVETNYHIYIIVNPDTNHELLIETTDPRYGLIKDQSEIAASKNDYLRNNLEERNTLIAFDFNIERRLEHKELIGLLYYNQSIKEMNNGDWEKAMLIARKAQEYYSENRVATLLNAIGSVSL